MELPEDVLTIVRAYSRPQMQYVNEYYAACREISTILPKDVIQHHFIKEKLYTKEAKPVMDAFRQYVDAALLAHHTLQTLNHQPYFIKEQHIRWQECVRLLNRHSEHRDVLWNRLIQVLYGR